MTILLPGGAGYIGSHTAVELLNNGFDIIILDNFSNSSPDVLDKIKLITNKEVKFYEGDLLDREILEKIFILSSITSLTCPPLTISNLYSLQTLCFIYFIFDISY